MTITSPALKRSVQIKVTLTADLHARLRNLSTQLGQVPASIAAIAVAEYVRSREIQAGAIQSMGEQLLPMIERQLGEQLKLSEAVEQNVFTDAVERAVKQQLSVPAKKAKRK